MASLWNITRLDYGRPHADTFHVHHDGDKASARHRARRMAEYAYSKADGYTHKWSGDCSMVFKGTAHVADFAVEPLPGAPPDAPGSPESDGTPRTRVE